MLLQAPRHCLSWAQKPPAAMPVVRARPHHPPLHRYAHADRQVKQRALGHSSIGLGGRGE